MAETSKYLVERALTLTSDMKSALSYELASSESLAWTAVGTYDAKSQDDAIDLALEALPDEQKEGTYRAVAARYVGEPVPIKTERTLRIIKPAKTPAPSAGGES